MSELAQRLTELDRTFDPALSLVRETIKTPGYHTRLPDGTVAHPTRSAMDYALLLLDSNEDARLDRATAVIRKIVSLQDTDPTSATYGIWSWFYDEPLNQMSPPDWNWADFIGARLAQAIATHGDRLPRDVVESIGRALRHAAWSIFRRNVGPGYTNIAIMGAMVTAAAGELLGEPFLLNYGRRRIENCVANLHEHGSFQEYNSPTYTMVVLEETDRLLLVVQDAACRTAAEKLADHAWELIAGNFHPATGQWAGPHSRAYDDRLHHHTLATLEAATGLKLTVARDVATKETTSSSEVRLTPPIRPCPTKYFARFSRLPEDEIQIVRRFIKKPDHEVIGTTWLTDRATLGSINRDNTWTQRRFLIGYLNTPADPSVVFRVSVRWNGRDFTAFGVRQVQNGPRVLSAFHALVGTGAFHPNLDRMPDSIYPTTDLRVCCELLGRGVKGKRLSSTQFELSAEPFRVVINWPIAEFDSVSARLDEVQSPDVAGIHAILHQGPSKIIDFKRAAARLVVSTEVLRTSASALPSPTVVMNDDQLHIDWPSAKLHLTSPLGPVASQ